MHSRFQLRTNARSQEVRAYFRSGLRQPPVRFLRQLSGVSRARFANSR